MTANKYKAGVIGCGFGEQHIQWIKECGSQIDIAWIGYRSNRKHALEIAKKHKIKKVTDDAENMLCEVDFIVIVTPVFLHYPLAKSSILQKKSVVCDKPLAMNSQEALSLVDLARQHNVSHMVLFQWRFNKHLNVLKKVIEQGLLGNIHLIQGEFFHDFILANGKTWRHDPLASGSGAFGDMGVHLIDCIQWLMNDRIQVDFVNKKVIYNPTIKDKQYSQSTEDYGMISFSLKNKNVGGVLSVCRTAKGYHFIRMVVVGEKGTAVFEMNPSTNQGSLRFLGITVPALIMEDFPENPYYHWLSHLENKTAVPNFEDGALAQQVMDEIVNYGK